MKWYAIENTLIGGWAVANINIPMHEHDLRPDGDPAKRAYVVADLIDDEDDVNIIAILLNRINYVPMVYQKVATRGWWDRASLPTDEGVST